MIKQKELFFFISDGEIKSSDGADFDYGRYQKIANLIDNGAVLGYGKKTGERIKIKQKLWLEQAKVEDNNKKMMIQMILLMM